MNYNKYQAGVGLMEVLVALLLLAIGVLGYVALQLRAIDASSEALTKSQGILILRGLAEIFAQMAQAKLIMQRLFGVIHLLQQLQQLQLHLASILQHYVPQRKWRITMPIMQQSQHLKLG